MIQTRPYDSQSAYAVLSRLDLSDHIEAELVRGEPAQGLDLFADWRSMRGAWIGSHVFCTAPALGAEAFAVGAIVNTGQAGVAQAALLARDHRIFRRPLAELGLQLSWRLPAWCAGRGIHRVEARCWAQHPTAPRFLSMIGFQHEADLPGFGADGRAVFSQFSLPVSKMKGEPACA